ncbi:MAG: hypothetical protein IT331_05750 [Anaerolineae bacterium]|nr:hypothetical protein [Anaerolineae bacterium]
MEILRNLRAGLRSGGNFRQILERRQWGIWGALLAIAVVADACAPVSAPVPAPTAASAPTEAPATVAAPTTAPQEQSRITFGAGGEPTTLDPHIQLTGVDEALLKTVYDGLIDWTGKPGEYVPALATEWSVSPDGLKWTFKLREGVKFSDGTDFDAEAVKFNVDRALASEGAAWRWEPFVKSVRVVDKYTVEFTSPKPHAGFLDHISWGSTVFHSPAALEKYGDDLKRNPVGTGPFTLEEWKPGEFLRFKRNPNYWREGPNIDELIVRPIPDYSARVLALESGDVDVIQGVGVVDVERLKNTDGLKVEVFPSVRNMYLIPNMSKELMAKKEVRQALNYAVDREAIVKNIMAGVTRPSNNYFSSNNFGFINPTPSYTYDPEKAKELLQQAGVAPGTKLTIMSTDGRYYGDRIVAEALQGMFNAVGFDTEIWQLEWPTYAQYMWGVGSDDPNVQRRDMALTDYGAQDPVFATFAELFSDGGKNWPPKGGNATYNDTPELDKLIDEAWATLDPEERKKPLADMQNLMAEEALRIFIMEQSQVYGSKDGVTGFVVLPNNQWSWRLAGWQ